MLRVLLAGAFLAPALPAAAQDAPARPWCGAGPMNAAERTICATPELSRLDARLAEAYGRLRSADDRQDIWLRQVRDACGRDVTCLRAAYVDRIRFVTLRRDAGGDDGA